MCEHRRCKLDSGSFSGFVTGGCGGVLVKAAAEKATVEEVIELIAWAMDKTNCWSMQKLQRAKVEEVEEKKYSPPFSEYLQCLQEVLQNQGEENNLVHFSSLSDFSGHLIITDEAQSHTNPIYGI